MSMEKARLLFFEESNSLLSQMKENLTQLETTPADVQTRSLLFRAAHTIKGSAGIFGHPHISDFMQHVEDLLAAWRDKTAEPTQAGLNLMMRCREHAEHLVSGAERGEAALPGDDVKSQMLVQEIHGLQGAHSGEVIAASDPGVAQQNHGHSDTGQWRITYSPLPNIFQMGLDPLSPLRELASARCLTDVSIAFDQIPPLEHIDPEQCFLLAEISAEGISLASVHEAFEYFEGAATITIH